MNPAPNQNQPEATVADAFEALLGDLIPDERVRKDSLESRGVGIMTSSGTLVTLLLALSAVVTQAKDYRPSGSVLTLLAISAIVFVMAAALSTYNNSPARYLEIDASSLRTLTAAGTWDAAGSEARRQIAAARLEILRNWQEVNQSRARILTFAMFLEIAGILVAATAVVLILSRH